MPQFFPLEFNGFRFENGDRVTATFIDPFDQNISGISTKNSDRVNERPKYSGTTLGGVVKVLSVFLQQPKLDRNDLVIAMDAGTNVQHRLYSKDELGDIWYVNAKATRLTSEAPDEDTGFTEYTFTLDVDDPVYRSVKEYTDIWNVVADEELHTITIGGNQPTNPTFSIVPGEPIGYYPFTYWIKNYNPIAAVQTDAMDITNGGWNTAALIGAGDMLANGDDVRVIVDGVEVPRWFGGGGIDSTTTKIYIRAVWRAGGALLIKLRTALSGVTTPARIEFQVTTPVKAILATWPVASTIRVGNEEISYRNLNSTLCQADIVSRHIRGTSIASHAIGVVCYWVEHDIRLIWGNAVATAPAYEDTYKPQWDISSGSNSLRTYNTTTGFADTAGLRAGAFQRKVVNDGVGNLCRVYTGVHATFVEEDPADVMGMEITAYEKLGKAYPDTGELRWTLGHPAGFQTVESDGEKFKSFSNTNWPGTTTSAPIGAALESSPDSVKWVREWFEDAPSIAGWEDIDHDSSEPVPATTKFISYHFYGSTNGLPSNFIRFELDESIVQLIAANMIQVGFNALEVNYQLVIEIRNNRTGESLFVDYPAAEAVALVIDTENFTVTYQGLKAIRGIFWSGARTRWLKFLPGDNELQFFSSFGTEMAITTTTDRRAM